MRFRAAKGPSSVSEGFSGRSAAGLAGSFGFPVTFPLLPSFFFDGLSS